MRIPVFALALLLLSSQARAAIWELPLGPFGAFRLEVPSGWTAKLAAIAPHIRLWRDSFTPPHGAEDDMLAASPDLGGAFELQERVADACPGLNRISVFNYAAVLSHGKLTSGIPSISDGAQRLAQGLVRSLFVEDQDEFVARFAAYDKPELLGDEWTDADATAKDNEIAHA